MTMFGYFIFVWLLGITAWLVFRWGKGPQGEQGERGYDAHVTEWEIERLMDQRLDNAEYMTKLIQKINSYQLQKGDKLNE